MPHLHLTMLNYQKHRWQSSGTYNYVYVAFWNLILTYSYIISYDYYNHICNNIVYKTLVHCFGTVLIYLPEERYEAE